MAEQKIAAGIDSTGRAVPLLVDSTGRLLTSGPLVYQGTWDANANTPTLASGTGTKGYFYVVSVSGSTNLDGVTDWVVGDWAVFNGTAWEKADHTDVVTSVFGRQGAVVAATNDYTWAQIDKTTSDIANITTRSHASLTAIGTNTHAQIDTHIATVSGNPHVVTAAEVGLGNVPNIDTTVINLDPFFINGNGFAIVTGEKGWIRVPVACSITGWEVTLDQSATFTVDLWKDTYANYPPTVADSVAFAPFGTSAADKAQNLAITPLACAAGDYIKLNVTANDNAIQALIKLIANRT